LIDDFSFLASQDPLPIESHTSGRRIRWLLDHEHAFTEKDGFIITDDYDLLESLQVRNLPETVSRTDRV